VSTFHSYYQWPLIWPDVSVLVVHVLESLKTFNGFVTESRACLVTNVLSDNHVFHGAVFVRYFSDMA